MLMAMLEIWREGRDHAAQVVQRLRRRDRSYRKELLATVHELFNDGDAYDEVVATYALLAKQYSEEFWVKKVVATRDVVAHGYAESWGLYDDNVYVDSSGDIVSAFEATGGAGGATNVKAGYKHIVQTPGVISQLREKLRGHSTWELERLARTETTRAYNLGMVSRYNEDKAVTGYEFIAIVDSRTTDKCIMLDGTIISKSDPRLYELTPPLHVNCRSQLSPVFVFDENIAATFDDKVTRILEDKNGKDYSLTYVPSRVLPISVEGKLTRTGLGRDNLMTITEAKVRRKDFVPPTPVKMREEFLGIKGGSNE